MPWPDSIMRLNPSSRNSPSKASRLPPSPWKKPCRPPCLQPRCKPQQKRLRRIAAIAERPKPRPNSLTRRGGGGEPRRRSRARWPKRTPRNRRRCCRAAEARPRRRRWRRIVPRSSGVGSMPRSASQWWQQVDKSRWWKGQAKRRMGKRSLETVGQCLPSWRKSNRRGRRMEGCCCPVRRSRRLGEAGRGVVGMEREWPSRELPSSCKEEREKNKHNNIYILI
mmetsp:Transcript_4471/g.8008  ORF Transcript_4471/g.8008 Transcript_4471/m.8008 type:complete len:223 (+) Transcript_4471:1415-2083(+)